jgi:hypothetical protein
MMVENQEEFPYTFIPILIFTSLISIIHIDIYANLNTTMSIYFIHYPNRVFNNNPKPQTSQQKNLDKLLILLTSC